MPYTSGVDRYAYLVMTLLLCVPWALAYAQRPDQRRRLRRVAVPGAIAGAAAEWWYFTDYWRPPTLFGAGVVGPEDFLVGAAITGLGVVAWEAVTGRVTRKHGPDRKREFLLLFLVCAAGLALGSSLLALPSIVVSELLFVAAAVVVWLRRPDLLPPSLASGALLGLVMIPAYLIAFTWLAPGYWSRHWLLHGTELGLFLLPDVPLTEFLWFVSWGLLAGCASHYRSGTAPVRP